ncbi:unnamed protein product [Rotaria socialis]|uniref:Uncharacterized protein n=1 Tax=Rotaria socialis TaxID=392032 RepID=A0A820W2E7_9BILA|nr:unnamed protein product [Rotaria socialis]CAF4421637.1 unnamed protein product [Rotaria socialis]CAF4508505.1 unnamed protein product [Rotaria socialis]
MQIVLILLLILQNFHVVQLHDQEKHFANLIKRDTHSSSPQNLNRYTKSYDNGQNIIFDTPNFALIDSLFSSSSIISINQSKSFVCNHTTWLTRDLSSNNNYLNQYTEIARYDSMENRFILNSYKNNSYTIDSKSGELTLINTNDDNLLHTEINLHIESGLSQHDDIIHDIYRLIRISTRTLNCTTNLTVNIHESIEIACTIEYEFLNYEDLDNFHPMINFTFFIRENNSTYEIIDQNYLNEIQDFKIDDNSTLNWKRSIAYTIKSMNKEGNNREYGCIVIPDTSKNEDLFQDMNRICRINVHAKNGNSSTVIFSRLNQWDLIDILIVVLIIFTSLLFIISIILCLTTKRSNKKRIVQIKPENQTITLPLNTKQTFSKERLFSNNNEIKSETPLLTSQQFSQNSIKTLSSEQIHRHKPGCPKYIPSTEHNLVASNLFTHTTIGNIKKIILPDIPQNNELFDDQTYIHFYIPSKHENISLKKLHSSFIEKDASSSD